MTTLNCLTAKNPCLVQESRLYLFRIGRVIPIFMPQFVTVDASPCKTGSRLHAESTIYFRFRRKSTLLRIVMMLSWSPNVVDE